MTEKAKVSCDLIASWYDENGLPHRDGAPALTVGLWGTRLELWYRHGILHRLDGPAVTWASGEKQWFIVFLQENLIPLWVRMNCCN